MVLAPAGLFEATQRVDARVTLLGSAPPLRHRARVHFHQGTAEAIAEVILLHEGAGELAEGGSAFAQLRLDKPLLLLPGDRFILRRFSPVETIGGGTVLDARAPRHKRKDAAVAPFLGVLECGKREEILGALVEATPRGLTLAELLARTGWIESETRATAEKLAAFREKSGPFETLVTSHHDWVPRDLWRRHMHLLAKRTMPILRSLTGTQHLAPERAAAD